MLQALLLARQAAGRGAVLAPSLIGPCSLSTSRQLTQPGSSCSWWSRQPDPAGTPMTRHAHSAAATSSGSCEIKGGVLRAQGSSNSGGGGPRGWWHQSVLLLLAAAAGTAGLLPGAVLLAEGRRDDRGSSRDDPAAGEKPTLQEHMDSARASLASLWQELQDDIDRARAGLPPGAADPGSLGPQQPPPPSLSLASGSTGRELQATLLLPGDCDASAVFAVLVSALSSSAVQTRVSQSYSSGAQVFHMELLRPGGEGAGAGPDEVLSFKVTTPLGGGRGRRRAGEGGAESWKDVGLVTVVLRKRPGGFSDLELRALVAAARAAYLGQAQGKEQGQGAVFEELERGLMDLMINELERQMIRGFSGGFQWMAQELERAFQQQQQQLAGEDEAEEEEEAFPELLGRGPFPAGGGAWSSGSNASSSSSSSSSKTSTSRGHAPQPSQSPESAAPNWGSPAAAKAVKQLQAMGAQVYPPASKEKMDWGILAGYEMQKRQIEDCLLYPLLRPEVYNKVAEATRESFQTNRPRAVLFDGPPGTGKTTSARVISSQAAVPLVYVPLEAVLSKWYGESEGLLAKVFSAAEALGGAIIFFDEMDALGGNRERGDVHEASRRMLSVLLREMDGFDARRSVVIGATNRKADLDAALLSRFDMVVTFGLPDTPCRQQILQRYARHLDQDQLLRLAQVTPGLSGRDLRDVAEHTERQWASRIVRGEQPEDSLPGVEEYVSSARDRAAALERETKAGQRQEAHTYHL